MAESLDRHLEKFAPAHLGFLDPCDVPSAEVFEGLNAVAYKPDYQMTSCFLGNRLFAVIGVRRLHRTCGEVFVIPFGKPPAKALYKTVLELIGYAFDTLGYKRLQATVKLSDARFENWIRRLGFIFEGTLTGYDPITGEDHWVYGRVK